MKKAVKKTANEVQKEIAANAPVKSGRYKKSWTAKKTKENSHTLEMTVHSKDRYQIAHLLEHGHAKRGGGRVAAIPHIAPAEANGEQMLEKLIEETESRAAQLLSDDDLFFVNAAGETELSGGAAGLGFNEKAVPFKSENP